MMPRGWSKAPVLDGWVQIIRGPRPKSEQWPKAGPQSKATPKRSQSAVSRGSPQLARVRDNVLPHRSGSRPPEAAFVGSHRSVGRKQSTFDPVEGSPSCCTCQVQGPPSERENRGVQELYREHGTLCSDGSRDCQSPRQKAIFESELRDGEARLAQLQFLSEAQQEQPAGPSVVELQRRIDQLVQECDALKANPTRKELPGVWTDGVPPILQEVIAIPGDRQDLEAWLSWRNCELRNALEFGDAATVARSAKMATFAQDVPMHGQVKSSMMAALIDQADAKRRCVEATRLDGSVSGIPATV